MEGFLVNNAIKIAIYALLSQYVLVTFITMDPTAYFENAVDNIAGRMLFVMTYPLSFFFTAVLLNVIYSCDEDE